MKNVRIFALALAVMSAGCFQPAPWQPPPEPDICTSPKAYAESFTITGQAVYKRRLATSNGLEGTDPTDYPVRRAEIIVKQDDLFVVQCATTDNSGNFSLQVPRTNLIYSLSVRSRASNSYVNVSVLDSPESNRPHEIKTTFKASESKSLGTLTAPATGTVLGGAFNILDLVLKANEFMRQQTANCSSGFADCTPFTTAPKATIYWSAGVNPAQYVGRTTPVSFYHPDTGAIYVLGGEDGDVETADTDHFDDTVVLHEYGHFIEHQYSKSDSPGGTHDANSVIDPRLAWSEGWSNYFALMVTGEYLYQDTVGNSDGSTSNYFYQDIENNTPSRDVPTDPGEGNFREFSITRALWDMSDPHPISNNGTNEGAVDDATTPFSEFWTILSGANGLRKTTYGFRNYGLFMELHSSLSGGTDISTILTSENQRADRTDYAAQYSTGGSCTYSMSTTGSGEDGTFTRSNQFSSNDFYHLDHGGGAITILVTKTSGAGDLDLYLYSDDYIFGDTSDIVAESSDPSSTDGGTEQISLSLQPGRYMINVNLYSSGTPQAADYKITINGAELCP